MLDAGMLLQAHSPTAYKLVAEVFQWLSPAALKLLFSLALTHFSVVQSAYAIALLLLVPLLLLGIGALLGDPPLAPPVAPDMGQVIRS